MPLTSVLVSGVRDTGACLGRVLTGRQGRPATRLLVLSSWGLGGLRLRVLRLSAVHANRPRLRRVVVMYVCGVVGAAKLLDFFRPFGPGNCVMFANSAKFLG
ncbi:hypothetical protein SEVIR_2G304850v4 [Setaria viridis]